MIYLASVAIFKASVISCGLTKSNPQETRFCRPAIFRILKWARVVKHVDGCRHCHDGAIVKFFHEKARYNVMHATKILF